MAEEWKWRGGIINGLGLCAWQEKGDHIRQISRMLPDPRTGGMVFVKVGLEYLCMAEEFPTSLIVYGEAVHSKWHDTLNRMWSGLEFPARRNGY